MPASLGAGAARTTAVSGRRTHQSSSSAPGRLRVDRRARATHAADRRHDPVGRVVHVFVAARCAPASPTTTTSATPVPPLGLATLEQDPVHAPQPDRGHRHPARLREPRRARLARHRLEVERDRAFREDGDALAALAARRPRRRATPPRPSCRAAPGSGARRAATARAEPPCRTARPWRGTAPCDGGDRRGTRARAGRGTRRGCSPGSPAPHRDPLRTLDRPPDAEWRGGNNAVASHDVRCVHAR